MTGLDRELSAVRQWMSGFERPIIEKLINPALVADNLFSTPALVSSATWLLVPYEKTLTQLDLSFEPDRELVELYLSTCALELSQAIERDLHLFPGHSHSINACDTGQRESGHVLREILVRVHLGAILVGELKWQKNEELYRKLVIEDRDDELMEHITSKSAEDELEKRLEQLCSKSGSSLVSLVTSFFIQTIVRYTKVGQCAFMKCHVEGTAKT